MPLTVSAAQLRALDESPSANVAAVYNEAADDYAAYADGNPAQLFAFDGPHAYADRCVWSLLEAKLIALKAGGASQVSLLDAGCGPGTWLRRLVTRALELGFTTVNARGFDIAQTQIQRARLLSRNLSTNPGVSLKFDIADLAGPLPEVGGSVDLTLCLYSVISHLPVAALDGVASEFARVTSGYFVTTVRPIGSLPTAFVSSLDNCLIRQDHAHDRCTLTMRNGHSRTLNFHLFSAAELRACFAGLFDIEILRGLDLFHSRFRGDPRWNPACLNNTAQISKDLEGLETAYAEHPEFIDRANQLLLVGRSRAPRQVA
jgi:SAM-dependent methyltransferase